MNDASSKPNGNARDNGNAPVGDPAAASHSDSPRCGLVPPLSSTRVPQVARKLRVTWLALIHLVLFALVYTLAYNLRFEFRIPPDQYLLYLATIGWVILVQSGVFFLSGYYQSWWQHVTFADLVNLIRASVLSLLVVTSVDYFACSVHIPRSVLILDGAFMVLALGAVRSCWRMCREYVRPVLVPKDGLLTLVVGTDHSSAVLAHQIQSETGLPYQVAGFLATNGGEAKGHLGQFPVLGHVRNVQSIAMAYAITDVLVTAGLLPGKDLRVLMDTCRAAKLNLKIIPSLEDRLNGEARIPIRSIEINDLLRRDPVELDTKAIGKLIEGATVMVTGAGGSIGSEICRQVLRFNPKTLVLVGRGENRIFFLERELRALGRRTVIRARIGDVTDAKRMRTLFEEHRPDVVFHAAAHKHVPLMEGNVSEAIRNNVGGTRCVADLADEYGVRSFVLISTDKAVRPCNIMGLSKHIAERYVLALAQQSATRFTVVRFGNVLGSAGSVVPLFQEQIRSGGPITVTDPKMTRYFMTIPEASQLVLQAATMGRGGEIFVLDMGQPVRIVDLARDMIRLAGLPQDAIEIAFTGIRPGEKLYEELYADHEEMLSTTHPKLRAACNRAVPFSEVRDLVLELLQCVNDPDVEIRRKLREAIAEYVPQDDSMSHQPIEVATPD
jgi:FlaA1/EpsC-like NDP-sugar epimerase